jgi:hypothetical protein
MDDDATLKGIPDIARATIAPPLNYKGITEELSPIGDVKPEPRAYYMSAGKPWGSHQMWCSLDLDHTGPCISKNDFRGTEALRETPYPNQPFLDSVDALKESHAPKNRDGESEKATQERINKLYDALAADALKVTVRNSMPAVLGYPYTGKATEYLSLAIAVLHDRDIVNDLVKFVKLEAIPSRRMWETLVQKATNVLASVTYYNLPETSPNVKMAHKVMDVQRAIVNVRGSEPCKYDYVPAPGNWKTIVALAQNQMIAWVNPTKPLEDLKREVEVEEIMQAAKQQLKVEVNSVPPIVAPGEMGRCEVRGRFSYWHRGEHEKRMTCRHWKAV